VNNRTHGFSVTTPAANKWKSRVGWLRGGAPATLPPPHRIRDCVTVAAVAAKLVVSAEALLIGRRRVAVGS